ncbi:MAG: glycosyltransferase family 2 protein [Anaerolineae bacterium]|nr:glycosyltransferase family 2 protein [Anaerolineae bacterium]
MPEETAHLDGYSIVIPAYNEKHGIGPVLDQLIQVSQGKPIEIIVVDDGSKDGTAQVVEQYPSIVLVRHLGNRGYGAALKSGIRRATHEIVCITDADGTYPNNRIPDLVEQLSTGHFDMVVGSRTGENVSIPLIRRPAKWMINQLANIVAGERIPDLNSGMRTFRRPVALRFFNILPDGFSFTTTITLAMLRNGFLVHYEPINYHARIGQSKIKPIADTLNFVQLVGRIALYFAPLRLFLPMSAALLLLSLAWGLISTFLLGALADVSTLVIAMTGIQIGVIGLLAELINQRLPNTYRND